MISYTIENKLDELYSKLNTARVTKKQFETYKELFAKGDLTPTVDTELYEWIQNRNNTDWDRLINTYEEQIKLLTVESKLERLNEDFKFEERN